MTELTHELPSGQSFEALVRAYFTGYHTMKPLFNGQLFLQEARKLMSWYAIISTLQTHSADAFLRRAGSMTTHSPGAHFLALYAAVMFAGSVVCPRRILSQIFGQKSREAISSRLYDLAICAVRLADFPKSPSLWTFAAFLIINSTWLREEQPLNCCSFVGLAFRVAQMLGECPVTGWKRQMRLNNDLKVFIGSRPDLRKWKSQMSKCDVTCKAGTWYFHLTPIPCADECHRWWTLVALDAQIALASGLPPMIESKLYHVEQPDGRDEGDVAAGQLPAATQQPNTVLGIFVCGRYTFYHHISDFLRIVNGCRVTIADVDNILKISHEIKRDMDMRRNQIMQLAQPAYLSQESWAGLPMTSEELHGIQSSPLLASLATSVLCMLTAKPYAIMYGPLRQHGLLPYLKEKEPRYVVRAWKFAARH